MDAFNMINDGPHHGHTELLYYRYDWCQIETDIIIVIMVKNASPNDVQIDFTEKTVQKCISSCMIGNRDLVSPRPLFPVFYLWRREKGLIWFAVASRLRTLHYGGGKTSSKCIDLNQHSRI